MRKYLLNYKRIPSDKVATETKEISREEVVAIFGEQRVLEAERMSMLGMTPTLIEEETWLDRIIKLFKR